MAAVLEARAVITAVDETGKAFTSIKERIAALTKQTEAMNRVLGSVGAVSKNVEAIRMPPAASADMAKFLDTTTRVDRAMADVRRSASGVAGDVGRASAEVVGLSGRLIDAGAKLKAIGDFRTTARGVKDATLAFQKAEQDARLLAAKVDGVPNPARSMVAAHAGALAELRDTERALDRQVAAASAARTALAELGVPLERLRSEEERLKSVVTGTNDALLRQVQIEREGAAAAEKAAAAQRLSAEQEKRHHDALVKRFADEDRARHGGGGHGGGHDHGFANYALTSAAMAVSAHEIVDVIKEGWHEGVELQHVRTGMVNAGRTPEEMREIEAASRATIAAQPTAGFTESMKVIAETTQAFGSVHHAIDNLPFMMKTMSVLKAAGGEHIHGSVGDVGRALAKTFEERQTRPEDFQTEAAAMIPAMVASGGTFNPEQLYAFAQQAKSSLPSLSMRFLSRIAPSLIGAQGGDRAGTALNAFESVISGKANDKKQAQEWLSLGLLDPSKVIMKNGQATSWKSGAVKDTFLAMTDPLAWSEKYLIPALQKQGVDTNNREAVKQILDTMFRNQNSNVFASEITQAASRARLHKDEDLINKTGDLDSIYKNGLGQFDVAAGALGESLKTLGAVATAPLMHSTAVALSGLAGALNQVSAYGLRHPTIAATAGVGAAAGALGAAGWLGKMLFDGFGLKGSAVALTGSAEALDAAAARLGAGGGIGGAAGKVAEGAGLATAAEGAPAALAVPGVAEVGAAVIAGGIAVGAVGLVKAAFDAQGPGMGGQWSPATAATRALDVQRMQDQQEEADRLRAEIDRNKRLEKIPGGSDTLNIPLQRQLDDKLSEVENTRRSIAAVDAYASHEARVGRAMMAMKRPEEFGPNLPDGNAYQDREAERGRAFAAMRRPEELGPAMPSGYQEPRAAGPIPVQIVGTTGERMPTGPLGPGLHRDFTLGNNSGGFSSPGLGSTDGFDPGPRRGAAGFAAVDAHPVEPHVDDSALAALDAKLTEIGQHAQEVGATPIAIKADASDVEKAIALLTRAISLKGQLAAMPAGGAGGTSGAVGTSYPQTAPTGRMGGPR